MLGTACSRKPRSLPGAGECIHFRPFDGWVPAPGQSVVAKVYPSIFRRRYEPEGRTLDEQNAYVAARWLADLDARGDPAAFGWFL